jgi:hypothetical protein
VRRTVALFASSALLIVDLGVASAQSSSSPATPTTPPAEKQAGTAVEKPESVKVGSKNALGKVKSVSADTLVVAGKSKGKETEWTFALNANTRIRKGGQDATPAELKEGDGVQVRYSTQEGKNVAAMVLARTEVPRSAEPKPAEKATEKKQ